MPKVMSKMKQKMKVLEYLSNAGLRSEEAFKELKPSDIAKIEGITFEEINIIRQMQEAVKSGRLFSFLMLSESEVK